VEIHLQFIRVRFFGFQQSLQPLYGNALPPVVQSPVDAVPELWEGMGSAKAIYGIPFRREKQIGRIGGHTERGLEILSPALFGIYLDVDKGLVHELASLPLVEHVLLHPFAWPTPLGIHIDEDR